MTEGARAERETVLVKTDTGFMQVSVLVYQPATRRRGTVYCLHDFVGVGQDFQRLATLLIGHGFRVIAPDMPGRGDSAFLAPEKYNAPTYILALMQLMNRYGGKRISMIGKGWGGMIALLLIARVKFELARLILADVPLLFSPGRLRAGDAISSTARFPTAEAAVQALVGSAEFAGLPTETIVELGRGRLRQLEGVIAPHFDPAIMAASARYSNKTYDIAALLPRKRLRLLHLSSDALAPEARQQLAQLREQVPGLTLADALAPGGRIHFTTGHQQLLTLGFLLTRMTPLEV